MTWCPIQGFTCLAGRRTFAPKLKHLKSQSVSSLIGVIGTLPTLRTQPQAIFALCKPCTGPQGKPLL